MSYLIRVMVEWDMQEHGRERESLLELDTSIGVMEDEFIVMHEYKLEIRINLVENTYFWEGIMEYIENNL